MTVYQQIHMSYIHFTQMKQLEMKMAPHPRHYIKYLDIPCIPHTVSCQVFERYHRYLHLHDFVQEIPVTLPNLDVVLRSSSEELVLETSENYTLTVTSETAVLKVN